MTNWPTWYICRTYIVEILLCDTLEVQFFYLNLVSCFDNWMLFEWAQPIPFCLFYWMTKLIARIYDQFASLNLLVQSFFLGRLVICLLICCNLFLVRDKSLIHYFNHSLKTCPQCGNYNIIHSSEVGTFSIMIKEHSHSPHCRASNYYIDCTTYNRRKSKVVSCLVLVK